MENQITHPNLKSSILALHPYQLACMILSIIAIVGAFTIIFTPTNEKLNDGALALIGSIVSFWMGRMGGSLANNNNNKPKESDKQ